MLKDYLIIARNEDWTIYSLFYVPLKKTYTQGELTFHGPIQTFIVRDGNMFACFAEGDAYCEVEVSKIKAPLPETTPQDEHHIDVISRERAIVFAKWTCESLLTCHGNMWYPYQDEDNPITGEQLYEEFLKSETENK